MTIPRFVQIHTLLRYPKALLSCDDTNLAKRLAFGGTSRLLISSQRLKRHWRTVDDAWSLRAIQPMAGRSRELVEREIMPRLGSLDADVAEAVRVALANRLSAEWDGDVASRQVLLLGEPEITHIVRLTLAAIKDLPNVQAVAPRVEAQFGAHDKGRNTSVTTAAAANLARGPKSARFVRTATSDIAANTEGAIHVAHAFTVHAEESETDYFRVLDDLAREAGSSGLFETEITIGLFYSYAVLDFPTLVAKFCNDSAMAAKVVEHLIHVIAMAPAGAKRAATAPWSWAELILLELGDRQPRTLANAFRTAVPLSSEGDLLDRALTAMARHIEKLDRAYGREERRSLLTTAADATIPGCGEPVGLDDLARSVGSTLVTGSA